MMPRKSSSGSGSTRKTTPAHSRRTGTTAKKKTTTKKTAPLGPEVVIDLKEINPFYSRVALLAALVIAIIGFLVVPEIKPNPYRPRVEKVVKVEKLPPALKNVVEPPPPPKPKMPVAAQSDAEVEQETIESTDFKGIEKVPEQADLDVPDFVPYDEPPQPIYQPQPVYPDMCREAGIEGKVYLKLLIDTEGRVRKVKVLKSLHPECDRAAIDAAYQWKFKPAMQRDIPVAVWYAVPFSFELTE